MFTLNEMCTNYTTVKHPTKKHAYLFLKSIVPGSPDKRTFWRTRSNIQQRYYSETIKKKNYISIIHIDIGRLKNFAYFHVSRDCRKENNNDSWS